MNIFCLGTGEACDPDRGNTSFLLEGEAACILLDCGFSVPRRFFLRIIDPDRLTGIWISHFHGDHIFGLPLLCLRLREMGRSKPLTIAGPTGLTTRIQQLLELAYPGIAANLGFSLDVREITGGSTDSLSTALITTTASQHSIENLAVRISLEGKNVYYSGDGEITPEMRNLLDGCDLVLQESFSIEQGIPTHNSMQRTLELSGHAKVIACVHIGVTEHLEAKGYLEEQKNVRNIIIPADGDRLMV